MTELRPYYRDTWAEVDLNAISENVKNIKNNLPAGVDVMAVVKADGYGHGAEHVAREALTAGATCLGVAFLDEAIALRRTGIDVPLLVLGLIRPEDVQTVADYNLTITVFQAGWIKEASRHLSENATIKCHVKLDSGMGRIGMRSKEELDSLTEALRESDQFAVEGLYTHLATADELDLTYFEKQQERFERMIKAFESAYGAEIPVKHCSNSAGALRFGDRSYNLVRLGIAMYGLAPSEEMKPVLPVPLQQAFSLHSRITNVKKLPPGEGISYGGTYVTKGEEWIATVPIGYADGWIRANQSGDVLVNGRRAKIVGRICMDQMMILLQNKEKAGTRVTIIGSNGGDTISVDEVARRLNTINYEIPCVISYRIPRVVKKNDTVIQIYNKII